MIITNFVKVYTVTHETVLAALNIFYKYCYAIPLYTSQHYKLTYKRNQFYSKNGRTIPKSFRIYLHGPN